MYGYRCKICDEFVATSLDNDRLKFVIIKHFEDMHTSADLVRIDKQL